MAVTRMPKAAMADDNVWASLCAARWAQRTGLPPGNMWEPGCSRKLAERAAAVARS